MKILKNFILKESKEEVRSFIVNFLALAWICILQQGLVLKGYSNIFDVIGYDNVDYITQMLNFSIIGLSVISITFMANSTMNRSIQKEKKNKSIIILISLGLKPKNIWFYKTIFSFITGYIAYCIVFLLDLLMIKFVFRFPFIITFKSLLSFFVLSPIISILLVLILSFLFWYFKNNTLITLSYTMVITFGTWILMTMISSPLKISSLFMVATIMIIILLYYIFSLIINKQEKWKIGLE